MSQRAQFYQYKGNRCASCGMNVPEMIQRYGTFNRMFQFHHVNPATKDRHYKRLMTQRLNRRQMDEIDKCVLLCTQCHATIHAQEITATLELAVELNRRKVTQQFRGWIKADALAKTLTFVTNEPYLLELCEVRFRDETSQLLFLVEIEQKGNLVRWLTDIEKHKSVEIRSLVRRGHFMRIEHVHGRKIRVVQTLGLPILSIEAWPIDKPNEVAFVRNGFFLSASGELHSEGQMSYDCNLDLSAEPSH
jgi:hypothetical protein